MSFVEGVKQFLCLPSFYGRTMCMKTSKTMRKLCTLFGERAMGRRKLVHDMYSRRTRTPRAQPDIGAGLPHRQIPVPREASDARILVKKGRPCVDFVRVVCLIMVCILLVNCDLCPT